MSEYNDNNIHGELEEILDNVFNKYVRTEEEYKELCVQLIDKNIEDNPEAQQLISTFESIEATNLEAKVKLAELMLAEM